MSEITTGVWRIASSERYLRNFGSSIVVAPGKADRDHNMMWRLDFMDEDRTAYTITNIQTGHHAFAAPPNENNITIGPQTKWSITKAGGEGEFHIQFPNKDLHWTVIHGHGPAPVFLEGLVGKPEQVWRFEWVGDR